MSDNSKNIEYEICVMCGKSTDIPVSLPVDYRKNYMIGIGQLCEECSKELDRKARKRNSFIG